MNIETLTAFFMWCSIINGAFFLYATLLILFAPNFVYKVQTKFFQISRETWDVVMYSFLGIFKLMFLIFCLVPYLALLIIA